MATEENYVKVLFRFYSNVLEQQAVETMWAEIIDQDAGVYELNSIPFYAPNLACGDVILAFYDEQEEMLTYKETISFSGNSTVQVVIFGERRDANEIRNMFDGLGCSTEKLKEGYFVIDVPVDIDYVPIKLKLEELSRLGIIDYAEPCLSAEHGSTTS